MSSSSKVAFITGGSTGIGLSIAQEFLKSGVSVFIVSRNPAHLQSAMDTFRKAGFSEVQFESASVDVRKFEELSNAVAKCLAKFKRLDYLINSAAGNFLCPAASLSSNGFRTVIEIDLIGTFNAIRAAFDGWMGAHGGIIVSITATLHLAAMPAQAHAGAAKAGVDALTRQLGVEWSARERPIRVAAVAPGPVGDTLGFDKLGGAAIDPRYLVTRAEVADAVLAICRSPWGAGYTGQTLVLDRGQHLAYAYFDSPAAKM